MRELGTAVPGRPERTQIERTSLLVGSDRDESFERRKYWEALVDYIWKMQWQVYVIATFRWAKSAPKADDAARALIEELGVYGLVARGEGSVTRRQHIHFLLGGVWSRRLRGPVEIKDVITAFIQKIRKYWRHGMLVKVEQFDPSKRSTYLVDHHEIEIIGTPKRHRSRRNRSASRP